MASYFELPAQEKAPAAATIEAMPEASRKQLGGMSLLSPAVTQLLDDLGEEHSDSDSDKKGLSGDDDNEVHDKHSPEHVSTGSRREGSRTTSKSGKGTKSPRKNDHSPPSKSGRGSGGSLKPPRQPHMARFHSLRSMLFTSNVENKMSEIKKEDAYKQEAADKWKSQHEQRQMSRPKTPEKEKDLQGKDKFGSRIKTKLRRITSKDPPTLDTLNEHGAAHDFSEHGSTASSDADDDELEYRKYRDDDEESINHSDVEDLVRWVSRRDPPSDGEARADRKAGAVQLKPEDSGHESLGHSDVEDLVRWVSRRSEAPEKNRSQPTGYSDVSTESDSENLPGRVSSDEEEDADDLVRWISHRDGPTAGPIRKSKPKQATYTDTDDQINYGSDVPELGRWVTRHDGTSGESVVSHDVEDAPEIERGRPRSRDRPLSRNAKNHLTEDDIGDLVRWVSRHDSKEEDAIGISETQPDEDLNRIQRQEEAKQHAIGMSVDEGSLSHSDVKDLIEHVQSNDIKAPSADPSVPKIEVSTLPVRPGEGESGTLRRENTFERDARKVGAQEHLQKSRAGSTQMDEQDFSMSQNNQDVIKDGEVGGTSLGTSQGREREGSMGQEDVDELVKWVSAKH